jgi:hypothetical protein
MSFLRKLTLFSMSFLFGSLLLSVPVASYADLSMKPRTCSNCSGFSGNSSSYPHRPSMGISGHKSFGNQNFKSYRPKTYDSFKHSGKRHYQRDKPHYRDYRPKFDNHRHHYRPHGSYHHNGIGLSIVAPIVYSGAYYNNVSPRTYSAAPDIRAEVAPSRNLAGQNIDAWAALGNYQTGQAIDGFTYQSRQNPNNALPKVGYSLATALTGEYDKAAWVMELALAANVNDLHYFQADANLQLVLDEMLPNYADAPLMSATILYLQQNYQAADKAINESLQSCNDCRGEQNLQLLINRKLS